jgi:chaperone modulatory protein CbpM
MDKTNVLAGVLLDDYKISFVEICEIYKIPEEHLFDILDHGLISNISYVNPKSEFDRQMLERILRALRLQCDLGINAAGVVLALELIDELDVMAKELEVLKKHMDI